MIEQRYDEEYFADNAPGDVEARRLDLLEITLDPMTIRRFEGFGIEKGSRCLEVGAGRGSVTRWLSERVGPEGSVVATDINTRFLNDLDMPNIEVRQHDIVNDELGEDLFDLVHCRHVLPHLAKPEQALRKMVKGLRPGGLLFIEDLDAAPSDAVDPQHPSAEIWNRSFKAVHNIAMSIGAMDVYFGRRVLGLVEELGLTDIDHEGTSWICRGGDPYAQNVYMTFRMLENMVGLEMLTEAGYKRVEALQDDPSFAFLSGIFFGVWGRKPQ